MTVALVVGYRRALTRSLAATIALSVELSIGMITRVRSHARVSVVFSDWVFQT